jgi:hypothetical protein
VHELANVPRQVIVPAAERRTVSLSQSRKHMLLQYLKYSKNIQEKRLQFLRYDSSSGDVDKNIIEFGTICALILKYLHSSVKQKIKQRASFPVL